LKPIKQKLLSINTTFTQETSKATETPDNKEKEQIKYVENLKQNG